MADIDLTRPHDLGLDGARRAADAVAARLRSEYGVTTEWDGDSIRLKGRGVRGRLDAQPAMVRVTASLGLAARPFRRALRREIKRELDQFAPTPPRP